MYEPKDDGIVHAAGVKPRWGRTTDKRWVRWSAKMKAAFLDHLAATCNVVAAADVIGVDPGSVYAMRRRDPVFAAGWAEALAAGYEMLETQLVGHALSGGGAPAMTNGAVAITGPIDVELAIRLLGQHRGAMQGKPFRGGPRPKIATREETNAAILKKLRVAERRVAAARDGGEESGEPA